MAFHDQLTHPLRSRFRFAQGMAFALACTTVAVPAHSQQIGVVASVEQTVTGTPPDAAMRQLEIGAALVQAETLRSSATGRAQILFVDETTMSIAPNTTIVLDHFVFDPDGSGSTRLQMLEGALRFIGGRNSRTAPAEIATRTAVVGIRGSSALVAIMNGRTTAVFLAGEELCVTAAERRRRCTSRQGGVLNEDGYQGRVSPEFLAQLLQEIDGEPGAAPPAAQTTPLGSGLLDASPRDRAPTSTSGEEFDLEIFEDTLRQGRIRAMDPPTTDPVLDAGSEKYIDSIDGISYNPP